MAEEIRQEVMLPSSAERVYRAFMDSAEHAGFTGKPAEIHDEAGKAFSVHGGAVTGRNIELVPNRRIVQAWRVDAWDAGTYSIVKMELDEQEEGATRVTLDHAGFPPGSREHLEQGWTAMYWDPLKSYLEGKE